MERFDVLNRDGEPTGLIADKGAPLKDGHYYLGVHAYIFNSSVEFLVQQRSFTKDFRPGAWDILMGHVIAGETSRDGIIREIREEIGLVFQENGIRHAGRILWEKEYHLIDVYFLKTEFEIGKLAFQKNEVIGAKAISKDDMLAMVEKMNYRPNEYRQLVVKRISELTPA